MKSILRHVCVPAVAAVLLQHAAPARAEPDGLRRALWLEDAGEVTESRVIASPYTLHYHYKPDHRPVHMLGTERQYASGSLIGAAYFSNSFGQDCLTAYRGERYRPASDERFYTQWTAGVIYGYKAPYADEVPLNVRGFSPHVVVSVGWQFAQRYAFQVNALGFAALMFQLSVGLP